MKNKKSPPLQSPLSKLTASGGLKKEEEEEEEKET
jgi:hypothetical protein